MNKIEELIYRLCPNGVEYKELWELTIWDKKFNGTTKEMQPKIENFKHISAKELKNLPIGGESIKLLSTGNYDEYTNDTSNENINCGEVIAIPSGGNAKIKYYSGKFIDSGNILAISKDIRLFNLKFIYYYLQRNITIIAEYFRGSGIKHPEMKSILKIKIPVPPIEVQKEIVRILDQLSKFTEEIKEKLAMEFTARKQQYEFYRDELLNIERRIKNIAWVKMDDIFYIRNGYTPAKNNPEYWNDGIVPWFRLEDIRQNGRLLDDAIQHVSLSAVKGGKYIKSGSLIISTTATIGEHALVNIDCLTNQQITSFTIKENMFNKINIKYIFYYFFKFGKWCVNNANNCGNLPIIGLRKLNNYLIPIPILEEQNHIVSILDKFDKIVNDLTEGLPAEIEARQKQFEYYREKLLTFKEKVN